MPHEKAIVISKFWANLYGSILVAILLGGFTYAWAANAQIAVLQRDVTDLKQANIDVRLARMEEKLDWLVRTQAVASVAPPSNTHRR